MRDFISENFIHVRQLAREIDSHFSKSTVTDQLLIGEMAGMFAVTIVASYEAIIKETLISYTEKIHPKFHEFTRNDLEQTNARIRIDDLRKHAKKFGLPKSSLSNNEKRTIFDDLFDTKRKKVEVRFRRDLVVSYNNLFKWRNDYAHERMTSATLNDVYNSHRVGQYVVRCFAEAFETI